MLNHAYRFLQVCAYLQSFLLCPADAECREDVEERGAVVETELAAGDVSVVGAKVGAADSSPRAAVEELQRAGDEATHRHFADEPQLAILCKRVSVGTALLDSLPA